MKGHREPLQRARWATDAHGVPVSEQYGDVYHSRAGALQQAEHVFIRGTRLLERWQGRATFTVCETGFGLGNNFLALWHAWRTSPQRPERLHVVSFEAHPFSRGDLAVALAGHDGNFRELADALLRAWPPLLPGLHRLEFEGGRLTLTLAFGTVQLLARQIEARVDAFFLDGFAPRKNPAMWSRELFGQLVRVANAGATLATWCSVGQVRRDLAAAGFLVSRQPGFGGKLHMSSAVLRPGLGRPITEPKLKPVAVVGGGLAGAGVAHSLALRGHEVTVFDPAFSIGPGGTHEGHRCAAMTPALSRDDNPMSRLSRAGILLAYLRWQSLDAVYERCGSLVRVAHEDAERWQTALRRLALPLDWVRWCPAEDSKAISGAVLSGGAVWLAAGAKVRPAALVAALLTHDRITIRAEKAGRITSNGDAWDIYGENQMLLQQVPTVVIAAASDSTGLLASTELHGRYSKLESTQRMSGQVAYFPANLLPPLRSIVAGAGYCLPQEGDICVAGSTYSFEATCAEPTLEGQNAVAAKVATLLELESGALQTCSARAEGWGGWRAALSDHLPVIGSIDERDSLWLACAYGSRGLSWMTLAGEIVAARLNAEPLPVERELLRALVPR